MRFPSFCHDIHLSLAHPLTLCYRFPKQALPVGVITLLYQRVLEWYLVPGFGRQTPTYGYLVDFVTPTLRNSYAFWLMFISLCVAS